MLVISGRNPRMHQVPTTCFNLAIEILVISGGEWEFLAHRITGFNLAIEILVISGFAPGFDAEDMTYVSISQSRCLSFQVRKDACKRWRRD